MGWSDDINSISPVLDFPECLMKPEFAWNGNASDIVSHINDGVFYVAYNGHGAVTRWGHPTFSINDLEALNNGDLLPVVFSMTCHTGNFRQSCLASQFLKTENGGCVGMFASTQRSYSPIEDALELGMFDAIWPSPGLHPLFHGFTHTPDDNILTHPVYELGGILNQGLKRMNEMASNSDSRKIRNYTCEISHLFGDPSMKIYTEKPTPFNNVKINRLDSLITVSTGLNDSRVSFFNKYTNEVHCFWGRTINFNTAYPYDFIICISAPNKIPFIDNASLTIQNEVVAESATYENNVIAVGSNVTMSKTQGPVDFSSGNITLKGKKVVLKPKTTIRNGVLFKILNE